MMSSTGTQNVTITDDDLIKLDGQCADAIQSIINQIKVARSIAAEFGLSQSQSTMMAEILECAAKDQKLGHRKRASASCPSCLTKFGYWPVRRTTKWKRKGQPDFDNPKTGVVIDLKESFVTIKDRVYVGYCEDCRQLMEPILRDRLSLVPCELPEALRLPGAPVLKRVDVMRCHSCGWEGPETDMGRIPSLMGGLYYGKCPKCPEKNELLGSNRIKNVSPAQYILIPVAEGMKP